MSPTQRELEEKVLEAAECMAEIVPGTPRTTMLLNDLAAAVRALRESKRPHKAAVLEKIYYRDFSDESDPMEVWSMHPERHDTFRKMLAELLAATDEPTEDKR